MHLQIEHSQGCFNIKPLFSMVENIFCFHAVSTVIGLFPGTFFYKNKVFFIKIKSRNGRTLFSETFHFKDFFPQDFFSAKISDFISENFFFR